MQATLREFEDWLEDSVPDSVMLAYEKALAKLEECLPFEDTLVSLETLFLPSDPSSPVFSAIHNPLPSTLLSDCHSYPTNSLPRFFYENNTHYIFIQWTQLIQTQLFWVTQNPSLGFAGQ